MNLDWNKLLHKDGKCGPKVIDPAHEPAAGQQQTEKKKFKQPKKPKKPKHQPPPQDEPVEPAPRPKTPPPARKTTPPAPRKSTHQEIEPNNPAPSPKPPPQAPIPTPARAPAMAAHKVCGHEYCQISSTSLCCNCGDSRKKTRLYEKLRFYSNYFT